MNAGDDYSFRTARAHTRFLTYTLAVEILNILMQWLHLLFVKRKHFDLLTQNIKKSHFKGWYEYRKVCENRNAGKNQQ